MICRTQAQTPSTRKLTKMWKRILLCAQLLTLGVTMSKTEDALTLTLERIPAIENLQNDVKALQQAVEILQETVAHLEEENTLLKKQVSSKQNGDASFLATFDALTVTPANPVVWNYDVMNPGGYYDNTTGVYTVPLDGQYEFNVHIYGYEETSVGAYLVVDDVWVAYTFNTDIEDDNQIISMNLLLPLVAGQRVWVRPVLIAEMYGATTTGMRSWFSGHLVHAN